MLPPPATKTEQRRGSRFPVIVPVQAKWQEASGRIIIENAQAREVNMQGGLLDMKVFPSVGSQMELANLLSGETYRARVLAIRRKDGRVLGVAVELLIASETFWGVNFQSRLLSGVLGTAPSDLIKLTICQRCGSGSFDQTGMPRRTTPFVRTQKIAPGVALCTSSARRLGAFSVP